MYCVIPYKFIKHKSAIYPQIYFVVPWGLKRAKVFTLISSSRAVTACAQTHYYLVLRFTFDYKAFFDKIIVHLTVNELISPTNLTLDISGYTSASSTSSFSCISSGPCCFTLHFTSSFMASFYPAFSTVV